ncbi:hypothetical protein LCGC14_0550290 [marine sediment metagenome]|uniref:Uncharacterized protein n=1 Tax=marine sediment metagenome TaxID=412755 RepID=A0A0F9RQ15_9ZZZZ
MDGQSYSTIALKLRSSGAVPIGLGKFLVQSFGVDENEVTIWPITATVTRSDNFTGASLSGQFISANFQRLPYVTTGGKEVFSGQTVGRTDFNESREDAFLGNITR